MPYSESQKRATMKWDKENYDRVYLTVPKGMKQQIEAVAQEQGMLEMLNEICGTQYGWCAKRVVKFRKPNGTVAERYAHFNDLESELRYEATH